MIVNGDSSNYNRDEKNDLDYFVDYITAQIIDSLIQTLVIVRVLSIIPVEKSIIVTTQAQRSVQAQKVF